MYQRILLGLCALLLTQTVLASSDKLAAIQLPPGFAIDYYAQQVPGARSLTQGDNNIIFVSTRGEGKIYALLPNDSATAARAVKVIADDLDLPNGIAYKNGSLYVTENSKVLRYDNLQDESGLNNIKQPTVIRNDLPTERHHGWRYTAFGPDDKLYIAIGAPCNICLEKDERFASISRMNADGSDFEVYAHGVRNSVGFTWHPQTDELWFTDNGRDWMGDDIPPDELNRAAKQGLHFGFPYLHGMDIADPEFAAQQPAELSIEKPVQALGPHVAALGLRFYTGKQFPAEYQQQIFIAEHGSWNRSSKIGYQISLVRLDGNKATSYEAFATGWMKDELVWGRPVDVLVMTDGALLVSDDHAGAVYRISYRGE